jgi:N4-gp56 family major capsid protein
MASQTFSTFSSDSQTYIAAKTLDRLKKDVIVYGLGKKEKLPSRFSKTFQYTRYDRLNLPESALTEGVTPDASTMAITTVQCTMSQWGSYVDISDVADITLKHPLMQEAIGLLAEQAAETIDREVIKVLLSNTSVYYPGTDNSRDDLGAGDVLTSTVVRKVVANLRSDGARAYEGRNFMGLVDPFVEMDLNADTTFVNAASYSNLVPLQNGEVGKWMGVRWVVSNLLPTIILLATPTKAASNHASGALAADTTFYFKVTAVDNVTGFETKVTAEFTQAVAGAEDSVQITCPSTSGFKYNVYAGSATGALKLHSSLNDPSDVVDVLAIPSSGDAPPADPASGITVHYSWILGKDCFAVPELMSLQTFMTPKQASDSDPLLQRRKASWKVMFKAVICNESMLARIETASAFE